MRQAKVLRELLLTLALGGEGHCLGSTVQVGVHDVFRLGTWA